MEYNYIITDNIMITIFNLIFSILQEMSPGAAIGFDPALISEEQHSQWSKVRPHPHNYILMYI